MLQSLLKKLNRHKQYSQVNYPLQDYFWLIDTLHCMIGKISKVIELLQMLNN